MNRRGFLHGILAAGMAPAIVKAEILMPVRKIIVPPNILLRGEIGRIERFSIISSDHVIDAQRYLNQAWRAQLDQPAFIHASQYHSIKKGRA
jgi:hypothetical protein